MLEEDSLSDFSQLLREIEQQETSGSCRSVGDEWIVPEKRAEVGGIDEYEGRHSKWVRDECRG